MGQFVGRKVVAMGNESRADRVEMGAGAEQRRIGNDAIDVTACRHNRRALGGCHDRRRLIRGHGRIADDTDDQPVAQSPRLAEKCDMARVK